MERLTSYKNECNREMICRWEDCLIDEEHCPYLNEDNCNCLKEILEKLGEYEDLEEQGLLMKLPCSIGSDVYSIPSKVNIELNRINGDEERNRVYHQKVSKIVFNERGWYMECDKDLEYGTGNILLDKFYKETWFLTQNEAEEALKRMEE